MANEFSTVDCCEEHVTQSEQWSEDAITASVTLRCAYADRHSLAADILINRRMWPYLTGPRAITAAIVPAPTKFAQAGQAIDYVDALVTINYSTNAEEELASESLEPTTEFITQDYRRFRWTDVDGDPLLEAEAPGVQMKGLNLVRTLYRVEPPLPAVLLTGVGGVNDAVYTSSILGLSFVEEGLLYTPPVLSRSITTAGAKAWQIGLKFAYKPVSWNLYFRAATGTYEPIYSIDSGAVHKNYPPTDFSALLA